MNKVLIAALLVGISGMSFGALQAQQVGKPSGNVSVGKTVDPLKEYLNNFQEAVKNADGAVNNLKTQALNLQKNYENELHKLQSTEGYDVKIYRKVVQTLADLDNDITPEINNLDGSIKGLVATLAKNEGEVGTSFNTVDSSFMTVQRDIKTIKNMTPVAPANPPGHCGDPKNASKYKMVTGFIDKASGAPTGWALKTLENGKVQEYAISKNVGLIGGPNVSGAGDLINPSYTPQGYKDSGWYDEATKTIICLSKSEQVR